MIRVFIQIFGTYISAKYWKSSVYQLKTLQTVLYAEQKRHLVSENNFPFQHAGNIGAL